MFHGMRPWGVQSEIIYCEQTVIGDVDLHNAADFLGSERQDEDFALRFERIEDGRRFTIRFGGIKVIKTEPVQEYPPEDEKLFYAFNSLGNGMFEFEAAAVSGRLEAQKVSFEVNA